MNDIEMLEAVLKSFGIGYDKRTTLGNIIVTLEVGEGDVIGYCGFCTEWSFTENSGEFINVGIWE